MKILIVEDDIVMHKSLRNGFKKIGYATDSAYDGEEALLFFEIYRYDAIILDLNLPKMDGIEVLKTIRKTDAEIKVFILSARSEVDDKITGLDSGANDYLAKPFHFGELEARLRALLRRKFIQNDTLLSHGVLTVDTALKTVFVKGNAVDLTKKEYGIMEYLMLNRDRVISAEELIEHIWDSDADLFSNSFKVHINTLKKKLSALLGDNEFIKNTRGVGYYLSEVGYEETE